jgi:hypothetical protein
MKQFLKSALTSDGRIWSGPARGLRLSGPESARVYLGLYEIELNRWIRRLVRPGDRCFDVGAQYGLDALMFARESGAAVITVEGDPALRPIIEQNCARNGLDTKIAVEVAWIGDGRSGTLTLDALAELHFWPDFVKLDIEGHEAAALRGSPGTLARCRAWLIETHGLATENECLPLLCEAGYRIEIVNPRSWLPDRRVISHNRWLIAVRP